MNKSEIIDIEKRFVSVDSSATFNRILDVLDFRSKKVLDLGCGWGEYLVKFGGSSVGITSTAKEVEYGKIRNIKILKGNVELIDELGIKERFEGIWANNLFEHLLSPHAFLVKLKTISNDKTTLVLGVPVVPKVVAMLKLKRFRGALAVAHVNFFTRDTLKLTVEYAGWKVQDVRPFVFKNRFLDMLASFFAPHLYVVAYNNENFRYDEKKLKEWKDESHYAKMISITKSL